jgi:putative ABC transport system substrate-binding protein
MKKILVMLVVLAGTFVGWRFLKESGNASLPLVAITQIIDHDALDLERKGIIKALADAGFIEGKTITIIYKSAQGNVTTAQQIANDFASRRPTIAVGISTPSAQALVRPMEKHGIPVVFTAVTDPLEAKLVSQLQAPHPENVTGVSDGVPVEVQLELIRDLLPSIRNIGVLYNPGEANSAKIVENLRIPAAQLGFTLFLATTSKTADTISAAQYLVGKVQAIFIPNDNTVMASISSIAALAADYKIPLFNPDFDAVKNGILAARACSHSAMGYKAGQMVVQLLQGAKGTDIPVETPQSLELAINTTVADRLGIPLSEGMRKMAKLFS